MIANAVGSLVLWFLLGWLMWPFRTQTVRTNGNLFLNFLLSYPCGFLAALLGTRSLWAMKAKWKELSWPIRSLGIAAFAPFGVFLLVLFGTIPYLMLKDWLKAHF